MGRRVAKVKWVDRDSTHVPERDGDWKTWYQARHSKAKADAEVKRIDALVKRADKKAKAAAGGKVRPPLEGRALEIATRNRDEKDRLRRDTRAFLASNPVLPSEKHPILQLWVEKLPKGKALKVGRNKEVIQSARSKLLGLREAYVVGHRDMRGFLRIDLDEVFGKRAPHGRPRLSDEGWDDLEARIEASPAPMGNVGVGATGLEDGIVRPHLIYLLKDSVWCGKTAEVKFRAKYDAVARRLVAALLEVGADPGGLSNGCKSKNPLSDQWSHRIFREEPWTLDELEAALPVPVSTRQLERKHAAYLAARAPKAGLAADHPDPVIASASNQAHVRVCKAAQAAVRQFRATSTFEAFRAFVLETALEFCLDPESAMKKADYVAPWTWKHYNGRVPGQRLEPVALKATRAAAARTLNWNRTKATMQAVMAAYATLPGELGRKPLVAEVAAWAGVSENSVRRFRPAPAPAPFGQQVGVGCPQKNAPRRGVVKKVLAISGDGKEPEEATPAPMESLPVEQSPNRVTPAAPVTAEPIPDTASRVPTRPVPATPARMPPMPSFLKSRYSPAAVETKPCPSTASDLSTTPPSPPAPPATTTTVTRDIPILPSTPVPTCSPSCGVLPTRNPSTARFSVARISPSGTRPGMPRSSGGSRNRSPDPMEAVTAAPPCDPGILAMPGHPPALQPHHGG